MAHLLPLYTRLVARVPMRVVSYPNGFEHHDAVYDRLLTDLEAG
jgi:hypothetical protein